MNFQEYKQNADAGEYQENLDKIAEARTLLDGTFKTRSDDREGFRIERLNRLASAIVEAIEHEKKKQSKATPAIDFACDYLGKIKAMHRDNPQNKDTLRLYVTGQRIIAALPAGVTLEPTMPIIKGGTSFIATAEATIKKLPLSIRKKIEDICIVETDTREIFGIAISAKKRCIHILTGNGNDNLKRTLLHEIAHVIYGHLENNNLSQEQEENAAKSFAEKYL